MSQPQTLEQALTLASQFIQEQKYDQAESIYIQLLKQIPNDINILSSTAQLYLGLQRFDEAQQIFDYILESRPDNINALNSSAYCDIQLGNQKQGISKFRQLIMLDSNRAESYKNLGLACMNAGRYKEAANSFKRAIELNPELSVLQGNLGNAYLSNGQHLLAQEAFTKLLASDPINPDAMYSLAFIELLYGHFDKAWPHYEARLRTAHYLRLNEKYNSIPLWNGEDLNLKSILVYYEHGFGDTIQFSRFLKPLLGLNAKVSCLVQSELFSLFKHNFPEVLWIRSDSNFNEIYDYRTPLHSLPQRLNFCKSDQIALQNPLAASKQRVEQSKKVITSQESFNIGIAWQSESEDSRSADKSILLSDLAPLFDIKDCGFHVLHKEFDLSNNASHIFQYREHLNHFHSTAALIAHMDLVITIDCCIAHLAASMNKETWLLVTDNPYWCWMKEGETSPWYSSVRIFRPNSPNHNFYLIEDLKKILEQRIN